MSVEVNTPEEVQTLRDRLVEAVEEGRLPVWLHPMMLGWE